MPDYNANVAGGIQPAPGLDFGRTLSTVADYQRAQAATQLTQLQALQQQRDYNALQAASQAYANNQDPVPAALRAGLDPNKATALQNLFASQRAMSQTPGGISPQAYEQLTGARRNLAETAKIGAETTVTQSNHAAQLAGGVISSNGTNDKLWKDSVNEYYDAHGGSPLERQQYLGIKDPDQRLQIAKALVGAGLTPEQGVKQETQNATDVYTSPYARLGGQPPVAAGAAPIGTGAPQPNSTTPGVAMAPMSPGAKKQQELAVERSDKAYAGIQAQAAQYERDTKPYLDLSRSILNNPAMYSGVGGNLVLDWNRVKAAVGDQQAAMLQEGLQKVTATSVLGQINQQRDQLMEAGGSSGRIFAQQVGLVEKAAPQLATTLGGNRFLVEVSSRMGDLNTQVRDMAANYKQQHVILDAGFDRQVSDYMKSHPIFTKEELSKPELLGVPTAPPGLRDTQSRKAWGSGIGLNPGDAFRVNGQYKYWGGAPQQ